MFQEKPDSEDILNEIEPLRKRDSWRRFWKNLFEEEKTSRVSTYDLQKARNEFHRYLSSRVNKKPKEDYITRFLFSKGIAMTDMAPIGTVKIGDITLEAISRSGFIQKEMTVRIVGIKNDNMLEVWPLEAESI